MVEKAHEVRTVSRAPVFAASAGSFAAFVRAVFAGLLVAVAAAQDPSPPGSAGRLGHWLREGAQLLDREDPTGAWQAFRRATELDGADPGSQIGLGRAHLMLGRSAFAHRYSEISIALEPGNQDAMALCVRALIRARSFDEAVRSASSFLLRVPAPSAELQAARASALFRVQRTEDAAVAYRLVVALDPDHAEGHLRLGSGLMPPTEVAVDDTLQKAVAAAQAGEHARSRVLLLRVLDSQPENPVAHRLLGETLYAQRGALCMAQNDASFRALAAVLPRPDVRTLPIVEFVIGSAALSPARRAVVDRACALFARQLHKLVAVGGTHNLLLELERTTDAPGRQSLRGKRTFDGRVWDDVRGIGGMQAATGIEALDEAAQFGFDTLVHELAHQVHFFAFSPLQRARIKALYQRAIAENRCLDYYAATNEAEYFGQGVEAFASLGKRPGGETTHGHTRFELRRVDPELHDFVAAVVDHDPLRDPLVADRVLTAAVAVALRCGRPDDALVAAAMMRPGRERDRLQAAAQKALAATRCH